MTTRERWVHLDGRVVAASAALLPPTDTGVLYGYGSFETVRLYRGIAFLAEVHEARLRTTLKRLEISPPAFSLREILENLAERNALPDARGRCLVTGGAEGPDGSLGSPRLFAEVLPIPPRTNTTVSVCTVGGELDAMRPVAGMKSLSYLPNFLARRRARDAGAEEAILRSASGELLEGATSNVHLVIDGTLVTPAADGRVLDGVTRGVVLEEARGLGIPVDERTVAVDEVALAEEAFLTSSIREVLPIARFDDVVLPAPGPVSVRLAAAYRARVEAEVTARLGSSG